MKAMVLAAGLGTRLRPLTNDRPKALVQVAGRTLLEITLARLRSFGVTDVIVNVHHFAEQVVAFRESVNNLGLRIAISVEEQLLDTGGGLKKAAHFFLEGPPEPFLVHNVDVISTIDLGRMVQDHRNAGALATLAVQQRSTSRRLLFDDRGELCGRQTGDQPAEMARPAQHTRPSAFSGIHVISPRLLRMLSEEGAFPIIDAYLRLAAQGEHIRAFEADGARWRDLGRPENIAQVEENPGAYGLD